MSAEAHFKTAAAELRRAIDEKRHDIDVLKQQLTEKESNVRRYVEQLRKDKMQKERRSGDSNVDDKERVELQRQAQQDRAEETKVQQGLNKEKDMLRRSIQNIQADIANLDREASQLEARQ